MDFSSHLLPSAIKSMCAGAKQTLKVDNVLYSSQLSYLDSFISDSSNNSPGIAQFKTHLGDYKLIIQGLVSSNDLDHADYIVLENSVGDEELIGKDILTAKIAAANKRDLYNSIADDYEREANNAEWWEFLYAQLCRREASKYRGMANEQEGIYQIMLAKEMFFDDVCSTTASLFTNSASIRSQATLGISEVLKVYGLKPVAVSSSTWKQDLKDALGDVEAKVIATIVLNHDPSTEFTEEEKMMIDKALEAGNYETVFDALTIDERKIYVDNYEAAFPDQKTAMDHLMENLPKDTDVHSYSEDNINVRFLAYFAPEPAKTVFFQYADKININSFDFNGTCHWQPSLEKLDENGDVVEVQGIYLDFDGYYDDNGKYIKYGIDNPRGPYITFFHEYAHAIDDLSVDGVRTYKTANFTINGERLQDVERQEVRKSLEVSVQKACEELGIEYSDSYIDLLTGPASNETLSVDEANIIKTVKGYYLNSNSVWVTDENGNNIGVKYSSTPSLELITDAWSGFTDNRISYGYVHDSATYWYSDGKETLAQSREFFAEYYSALMTYSPKDQMVAIQFNFGDSAAFVDQMLEELAK